MRPLELGVLYALIGLTIALAHWRLDRPGATWSLVLWPLFLPGLLSAVVPPAPPEAPAADPVVPEPTGSLPAMTRSRIRAAVEGLRAALAQWGTFPVETGATSLLAAERGLVALGLRLAQLDAVLATLPGEDADPLGMSDPLGAARRRQRRQLEILRTDAAARLELGLSRLTDLTTEVMLARFTGEAVDEVTEQLERLAVAVDAAGEVAGVRAVG